MCLKFTIAVLCSLCFTMNTVHAELTAHWKFDNFQHNADVLEEEVTDSNSLVQTAGTMIYTSSDAGILGHGFGNAALFGNEGEGSYYNITNNRDAFLLGTNDFTISGWFKIGTVTSYETWYHTLLMAGTQDVGGVNVLVVKAANSAIGKLNIDVKGSNAGNIAVRSNSRIDNNQWHWFAVVSELDGLDRILVLYVDGVWQQTFPYLPGTSASTPETQAIVIGKGFDGFIDELRIYNTALSYELDANYTLISGDLYNLWQLNGNYLNCEDVLLNGYGYKADLNGDCSVNILDFAQMASDWLKCNDPEVTNCNTPWVF